MINETLDRGEVSLLYPIPGAFNSKYDWEHERIQSRQRCLDALPLLRRPYGLAAATNRFDAFYFRDAQTIIRSILTKPANLTIPGVIKDAELSLDTGFSLLGGEPGSENDDQRPGKGIHQWQNGFSPQWRNKELVDAGFPHEIQKDGSIEIRYYGAGDVTSGAIATVAVLARAKAVIAAGTSPKAAKKALENTVGKYWEGIKKAYGHEITYGDIDQDGLLEDVPKNTKLLNNQCERDAGNTYDLEDGTVPGPPKINLHNNSIHLGAERELVWMSRLAGEPNLTKSLQERFEAGHREYLKIFYMPEEGYLSPLVYGPEKKQAKIFTSEAMEALYWRLVDPVMASQIVRRYLKDDFQTPWGGRSRVLDSTQTYINGPNSYWNGNVWPHDVARASEGMQNYGFFKEAREQDNKLFRTAYLLGPVETIAVSKRGNPIAYQEEKGVPAAGNPQGFAVGAVIGRSAEYQQPNTNFSKWLRQHAT